MPQLSNQRYQRRAVVKLAAATAMTTAMAAGARNSQARSTHAPRNMIRVEDLDLSFMQQQWDTPKKNRSIWGKPLRVGGHTYRHGIGTDGQSALRIDLKKAAVMFTAKIGLDDELPEQKGVVFFEVLVNNKTKVRIPVARNSPAQSISVDLRGADDMTLLLEPNIKGTNGNQADWLDPVITLVPGAHAHPVAAPLVSGENDYPEIASGDPETPEFHGPRVIGATPGRNFLFKLPYTGKTPISISVDDLPRGLSMDSSGLITGKIEKAGEYKVRVTAKNRLGTAQRTFRLVAGERQQALTPPMGWNSWNAYGMDNDARRTRAAADAMVKSGLAAKGFMYINLDDGWQKSRSADGEIQTTDKFGDMKTLADYVHSRGLRFGLYSSPGPTTCGGHDGSFGHELQDARTYARWGVDYLKYDWCSYSNEAPQHPDLEQYVKPYQVMRHALDQTDRDIFYSLCQYGMGHVWTWGGKGPVWGNSYRISGDINDSWVSMSSNGFDSDGMLFPFAGPGHWNDPDMLVVGYGFFENGALHWTKLTPHEQLTHITLWCMLAAPLLLGCDLEKLNKFTTDLITNTEVLAVNQDELGQQAQCVERQGAVEIWARPLWDGTVAMAVFNRGPVVRDVTIASWDLLNPVLRRGAKGFSGKQRVRDLWKRKDLGATAGFNAKIAVHGAIMLKVGTKTS